MQNQSPQANYQQQAAGNKVFNFDTDNRGQGRGYTWEIQNPGSFALAIVNSDRPPDMNWTAP